MKLMRRFASPRPVRVPPLNASPNSGQAGVKRRVSKLKIKDVWRAFRVRHRGGLDVENVETLSDRLESLSHKELIRSPFTLLTMLAAVATCG